MKLVTLLAFAALSTFGFPSCRTSRPLEWQSTPLGELTLERISKHIHEGNPWDAIQDLSALRRSSLQIPQDEIDDLFDDAARALADELEAAVIAEDFTRALRIYRSAQTIGTSRLIQGYDAPALQKSRIDRYFGSGDILLGLISLRELLSEADVDRDALMSYAQAVEGSGHERLFRNLLRDAELLDGDLVRELSDGDFPLPSTAEMIGGTVTVLVNRGIRLQGNVGYPDRRIGSGFYIDPRGYILTNYHVVRSEVDPEYNGFSRLFVQVSSAAYQRLPARVVGWDPVFDLALLKVERDPTFVFTPVPEPDYEPGDRIFAIGSPAGLDRTVTSGIVSATGRRFLQMGDAMQVDVPVNPGSSGGPLVNDAGSLVGIVFAGIEHFEGINFAVPSHWIWDALPRLYGEGKAEYPWIGLTVHEERDSLEVTYVVPGAPGHRAGLIPGDRILSINGRPMQRLAEAQRLLLGYGPDSLIELSWERDGRELDGIVSLGSRPTQPMDVALDRDLVERVVTPLFGMVVEKTGRVLWEDSYVVRRVFGGSIADETGLSSGDPFTIQSWSVNRDNRTAVLQIVVRKRKAGFLERAIALAAYLEIGSFL